VATTAEFLRRIRRAGFVLQRHGRSHDIWEHADGRRVIVARHATEIPRGTYRRMLRDAGLMERDEGKRGA
jgi:predicted RNA binding protein YcfA (HicA-like mRNA interferase family)